MSGNPLALKINISKINIPRSKLFILTLVTYPDELDLVLKQFNLNYYF